MEFFAQNFEIHPRDLRNILLYASCPVYEQRQVVDQLQFKFVEENALIYKEDGKDDG